MSAERPAFYALEPRRVARLVDAAPPAVHALAPLLRGARRGDRGRGRPLPARDDLLGFFLGVGLAAHASTSSRASARDRDPRPRPRRWRVVSLAGAAAIGVIGIVQVSAWLAVFIAVGAFLVVAYNLELFGGAFHSDLWFALAWGGFPALTGAFAQDGTLSVAAVLVAGRVRRDQRGAARPVDPGAPPPAPRRGRRGDDHAARRLHGGRWTPMRSARRRRRR